MKHKKIISLLLAVCLVFSLGIPTGYAKETSFADVTDAVQKAAVQKMYKAGYIAGYEDGTFRPNAPVLRAELVRMMNQVFALTAKGDMPFSDVAPSDWFYSEVGIAKRAGYIAGFEDGTFRPRNNVTREQACVMINKIMKFEPSQNAITISDPVSSWAKQDVESMLSHRIMELESNQTFRATKNITRGELCVALAKFVADEDDSSNTPMSQQELVKKVERVSGQLETEVLPGLSDEASQEIVREVIKSMNAYVKDPNYDYQADAKKVYAMYQKLSREKQRSLVAAVMAHISLEDIAALRQFFGI